MIQEAVSKEFQQKNLKIYVMLYKKYFVKFLYNEWWKVGSVLIEKFRNGLVMIRIVVASKLYWTSVYNYPFKNLSIQVTLVYNMVQYSIKHIFDSAVSLSKISHPEIY